MTEQLVRPLEGQDEDARQQIAKRVGARLRLEDITPAERQAAEALARVLAEDAVERVRRQLSLAIGRARRLPRDIALRLAHDVDSVACPFLEVTEVFSDSDWQQLVLTISRGARIAAAKRESLSEGLALALAELGDSVVAETLVGNRGAPMTKPVCTALLERFDEAPWVIDKLAERNDLLAEVVVRLCVKVSAAAREKLLRHYDLPDFTEPLAVEADVSVTRELVLQTADPRLPYLVNVLMELDKLTPSLLLLTLGDGALKFFELAVAATIAEPVKQVREIVRYGNVGDVADLFRRAKLPDALLDDYWKALQQAKLKSGSNALVN